jgi:NADPH:quinone reductase
VAIGRFLRGSVAPVRAWQVHRHGSPRDALRLVDIEPPRAGPGEILLRVRTAAVGMPDVFMCRSTYALTPPLPFVPGQEVCGLVEAVGEGVDVPLGRRLMAVTSFYDGRGGFADTTIARADSAYRVPDTMDDVDAASFRIGFSTAWIGLVRRGALRPGEWLLVLGAAGGSGATAVQLGRALGARVIAVAAGEEKLAFCERMGAEVLIDRTRQSMHEVVLEATAGRGVDVIYDPVGGEAASTATQCIAHGGRLLAVGFASGHWAKVSTWDLVRRNYSLVGVYAGGFTRDENEADHEALLALAGEGRLESFATVVPFEQLPDAVEAVAAGTVIGKMVVRVAGVG